MLTEDQKLTKLFFVVDQINKRGKYLWRFEKGSNSVGQNVDLYWIFNIENMENDSMPSKLIFCRDLIDPIYFFNCKDVRKDLLEQIVPLIHQNPKLLFFNINHMTSNDVDILDLVFSEYFISNLKTTLYTSCILFTPEEPDDQGIYELSKSNIVA